MQFLAHIPTAILNNIGFMALLFLIYETYKYIRKANPNHLGKLATAFELAGLFHFVITLYLLTSNTLGTNNSLVPIHFQIQEISHYLPYIGFSYFLLLLVFIFKTASQFNALNKYRQTANFTVSTQWNSLLKEAYNTKTEYKIGYSEHIQNPITFGWLDPVILLPMAITNQLTIEEVKLILLHEIAHIVRNDFFMHLIVETSHKILYFNPFSYLFINEISVQREMACDDWVINHTRTPLVYTKALYNIAATSILKSNQNLYLGAFNNNSELLERIKQIHNLQTKSAKQYAINLLFAGIGCCLLFMPIFYMNKQPLNTTASNIESKSLLSTIQAASLVAKPKTTKWTKVEKIPKSMNLITEMSKETSSSNASGDLALVVYDSMEVNNKIPTYAKLVDETVNWIKLRESVNKFTAYEETKEADEYSIAEKLLLRAILKNYQLKKALLNDKLTQLENEKEAADYLNKSVEWKQMLQYEKWTKEFLQKHPRVLISSDSLRHF